MNDSEASVEKTGGTLYFLRFVQLEVTFLRPTVYSLSWLRRKNKHCWAHITLSGSHHFLSVVSS